MTNDKTVQTDLTGKKMDDAVPGDEHIPSGGKVFRNYRDARGKSIGLIVELNSDRIFWKSVKKYKHFHRNHRAWAIATSVVEQLAREKVTKIVLEVEEDGVIYCEYDDFVKYSIKDQFFPYEEQMFLNEYYWENGYWRKPL